MIRILAVHFFAGFMISCGDKWLTGKSDTENQDQNGGETTDNIFVGMQDSTYRVLESDLNHPGNQ